MERRTPFKRVPISEVSAFNTTVSHCEVVDSAGVLQQLLERDGPAEHSVGRGGLPARSPRKAGAAASTAPRRHVQLYGTSPHKHTHLSARRSMTAGSDLSVLHRHVASL